MKKTLCLIMALVMILITLPALATAPGETATVTIKVTTSGCYARVGLNFDSSVLEFVSASGGSMAPNSGSGKFIFGDGIKAIGTASGSVTFRVKSGAPDGTYSVSGSVVECYDVNLNSCGCSVSGGSVTVKSQAAPTNPPSGDPTPTPVPGQPTPKPTPKPTAKRTKSPYSTPAPVADMGTYTLMRENEEGETETCQVKMSVWGLAKSEVILDGVKTIVNTRDLVLSENVRPDHQLAIIYAPNKGKASLRKAENTGSKLLESCDTGVIVPVLEEGRNMSKVNYLGKEGYVLNTSLRFYSAGEEIGTATVRNRSGADVILRLNRDNASLKLTKLTNGTVVTVIKEYKEWFEVDYAGLHGFVPKRSAEMNEAE